MQTKKLLVFTILCIISTIASGQLQIGYHYNIKKSRKDKIEVNYTISDTTKDANQNITGITISNFIAGVTTVTTIVDNSNGKYPVTTITQPGKVMCADKLKAALIQKEKDPSGKIFIDFWGISKESSTCSGINFINRSTKLGEFYYQINGKSTLGDITSYIPVHFATTEIGVATIPFKYRFGFSKDTVMVPNDFSASVNVGVYVGRKWGSTKFYADASKSKDRFTFLLGGFVSPTIISIDKENAFPTTDSIITKKLKSKSNQLGISTGIAATASINKDFNLGLYLGWDFGISSPSKSWYYSGKPWIGFGIGYKISMLGEK